MKANELMIDDWVYNKNIDKPMQVYPMMLPQMFRRTPDATTEDYNFFPVPLTTEILEKNGFEVQDQGGGRKYLWTGFGIDCEGDIEVEFQDNIPIHLKIDGAFKGEYYTSSNITYIHQLQHALRLCGIEKEIVI